MKGPDIMYIRRILTTVFAAIAAGTLATSAAAGAAPGWPFIHPHDQLAHRTVDSRTVIVQAAAWPARGTSLITVRPLHPATTVLGSWPTGGTPVLFASARFRAQYRVTFRIPASVARQTFIATVQGPNGHRKTVTFTLGH